MSDSTTCCSCLVSPHAGRLHKAVMLTSCALYARSAIIGRAPRKLDASAAAFLASMAELCMAELEKAWALSTTPKSAKLQRPLAAYSARVLLLDTRTPSWPVLLGSSGAAQALGGPLPSTCPAEIVPCLACVPLDRTAA